MTMSLVFLRLRRKGKVVELRSTPRKPFSKGLRENFTCLHPTCAEGPALAERKKAACLGCNPRYNSSPSSFTNRALDTKNPSG